MERSPLTETIPSAGNASGTVSPLLFGSNLEHTRADVFRGISAQMLYNRKFAGKPTRYAGTAMGWYPIGERVWFDQGEAYTRHAASDHMRRKLECYSENVVNLVPGQAAGIGQGELPLFAGKSYEFRIVLRSAQTFRLTAALTSRGGKRVYCAEEFRVNAPDWTLFTCVLTPDETDSDADLRVSFTEKASVFIGAVSLMPADHFRGMRRDVIEKLKALGISLLRWPGGNFAGEYCWEDGLLPVDARAPLESCLGLETQPHSMGYDYHELNTDDFIALCRELGAEPFLTINVAWNTPEENAAWVEYCNGDETTKYGRIRAGRGFAEPYGVKFWSLGNEAGYGHMEGDNSAEGYRKAAEANADAMLRVCPDLTLTSSGPYPDKVWWDGCAKKLLGKAELVSLHLYAPSPAYQAGEAEKAEYEQALSVVETKYRAGIREMRGLMGGAGGISYDEWNVWYSWYHQTNVYNGIFTALMTHLLIEEAPRSGIAQACHFEAVNEGMLEVFPDRTEFTAAGQILAAASAHKGGRCLFASRRAVVTEKDGVFTASLVNDSYDETRRFQLPAYAPAAEGTLYFGEKLEPCTKFTCLPARPERTAEGFEVSVPPHSVCFLRFS